MSSLDQNCLNNYRPVSNLPFLSKVCEKVVCSRLIEHMDANHYLKNISLLIENFTQQNLHSCGYTMILLNHWIARNVALIMLDISAAYDTVDHQMLLRRLQYQAGVVGDALNWMESNLEKWKSTSAY